MSDLEAFTKEIAYRLQQVRRDLVIAKKLVALGTAAMNSVATTSATFAVELAEEAVRDLEAATGDGEKSSRASSLLADAIIAHESCGQNIITALKALEGAD